MKGELFKKKAQREHVDITVSGRSKSMASKCKKKCSCLEKNRKICKARKCILDSALYIIFKDQECCNYHYSVGGDSFCGCPVRKEIFKKYEI